MDMQQGKLPLQAASLLGVAEAGRAPFCKKADVAYQKRATTEPDRHILTENVNGGQNHARTATYQRS